MAFENVDPGALSSSINKCISTLNGIKSKNTSSSMSGSWEAGAQINFNKSTTDVNQKISEIQAKLQGYQPIVGLITRYKKLKKENDKLDVDYKSLQSRRMKTEIYQEKSVGADGNDVIVSKSREVVDQDVVRAMNLNRKTKEKNKLEMKKIENQVSGMI